MIKVNLVGANRKKTKTLKGPSKSISLPQNAISLVLIAIVLGTAVGGYWWYASLSGRSTALSQQVDQLTKQKQELDAVIKADQIYEERKRQLENRVKVIEGLHRNQVSPMISLDLLSEAVDKTEYIWLSNLVQNNAQFSMSGTGTSMIAVANFMTNLEATGHFPRVDLTSAVANGGVVTFSISAEFARPASATAQAAPAPTGGN